MVKLKIKELISRGKIYDVIELIYSSTKDKELKKELIYIKSRLVSLEDRFNSGFVTDDKFFTEKNKITKHIIEIYDNNCEKIDEDETSKNKLILTAIHKVNNPWIMILIFLLFFIIRLLGEIF